MLLLLLNRQQLPIVAACGAARYAAVLEVHLGGAAAGSGGTGARGVRGRGGGVRHLLRPVDDLSDFVHGLAVAGLNNGTDNRRRQHQNVCVCVCQLVLLRHAEDVG